MNKKNKVIGVILLIVLVAMVGYMILYQNKNKSSSDVTSSSISQNYNVVMTDNISWGDYTTTEVKLSGDYKITKGGVYSFTGSTSGMISVDTDENVKIILNNVTIKNTTGPSINIISAKNTYIELIGENTIIASGTSEEDGAIYSKDDLIFEGTGTLNVTSDAKGIVSKDDLTFLSGTYNIKSSDDGIRGKDSVVINDGKLIINAHEGLEATYVKINGGDINITASDDGINAGNMSKNYDTTIEINGGKISIDIGQGDTDGIDSNGNIYINGGTISVNASSPFDYDGEAKYTGGTITINGETTNTITNQMMGSPGSMGGQAGMVNNNHGNN